MNRSTELLSLATRVAGVILAFGYLLGLVPGSVVALIGAVALMTFARAVSLSTAEAVFAAAGVAVLGAASGVAALRWGTLDLGAIRGAQGVLGPTVLVAPSEASLAAWLAAGAGVIALGASLSPSLAGSRQALAWLPDALVGALILVSVFWGPSFVASSPEGGFVREASRWALAALAFGVPSAVLARAFAKLGRTGRAAALTVAGAAVIAAAQLTLGAV